MIYLIIYIVGALILSFLFGLIEIRTDCFPVSSLVIFWPIVVVLSLIVVVLSLIVGPFLLLYMCGDWANKKWVK